MTGTFELPLGRLAMSFGALEWVVVKGIATIAAHDLAGRGNDVLPDPFRKKLEYLDARVRERVDDQGLLDAQTELWRDLETHAEKRNNLLHGPWIDVDGTNFDVQKNKLKPRKIRLCEVNTLSAQETVTPLDVETAADQTSKLIKRLNAHLEKIAAALKPNAVSTRPNPTVVQLYGNDTVCVMVKASLTAPAN